jgi:hypothetical protein
MTDVNLKIPNVIQMIVKDIQSNAAGLADADSFGEAKVRTDRIVAPAG